MTFTEARDAIENSISHTEISYCDDSPENRQYLREKCDDRVDAGEVLEFWKNDEKDGMEWRVHIKIDPEGEIEDFEEDEE